jgi:hypothetical protein
MLRWPGSELKKHMENEGITLWFAENKGDKKRLSQNSLLPLDVEQNKQFNPAMPKCY